ncbi:hypothetical protein ATI61_101701 [Archangium gephyra]|uniref:Uncharacterized protein n=1 Tax=Archangium gephyra TaxID=48 RepID=A0AAC8QBU0_9BACT|nr:hypothetical protein [Archangium gephyra]AKJ04206.1 Hypothetical protein AA314_05832 [Archangium gephyra]REG37714.1 hypothetical protein ATI61_101701 [Archangium gephyra]
MSISDAFIAGGFGMYPTLIAGVALLVTSIRYASRPESRYVPLLISLGLFTLFAGCLGFVSGVITMLRFYAEMQGEPKPVILYYGFQESLHNIALALLLTTASTLAASVGAWRLARQARDAAVPATVPVR